jgi:hypothetical protein
LDTGKSKDIDFMDWKKEEKGYEDAKVEGKDVHTGKKWLPVGRGMIRRSNYSMRLGLIKLRTQKQDNIITSVTRTAISLRDLVLNITMRIFWSEFQCSPRGEGHLRILKIMLGEKSNYETVPK